MNAEMMAELASLQGLREQKARGSAANAQRRRIQHDRALDEAHAVLECELAHDSHSRSAQALCIDRVGMAARRVMLAVTGKAQAREAAERAVEAQIAALRVWREASEKHELLCRRGQVLRRTEARKAADKRDRAALERRSAVGKDTMA